MGLRNPWRMAFDPQTDQLWVADVGALGIEEEVSIVTKGAHMGWPVYTKAFSVGETCRAAATSSRNTKSPIATYNHSHGCAIIGGRSCTEAPRYRSWTGPICLATCAADVSGRL